MDRKEEGSDVMKKIKEESNESLLPANAQADKFPVIPSFFPLLQSVGENANESFISANETQNNFTTANYQESNSNAMMANNAILENVPDPKTIDGVEGGECTCGLGKESVSDCLPETFFEPGKISLIIFGISLAELTQDTPQTPIMIASCQLGEQTCENGVFSIKQEIILLNIPTSHIFLLRKQLKDSYSRFETSNFNGR